MLQGLEQIMGTMPEGFLNIPCGKEMWFFFQCFGKKSPYRSFVENLHIQRKNYKETLEAYHFIAHLNEEEFDPVTRLLLSVYPSQGAKENPLIKEERQYILIRIPLEDKEITIDDKARIHLRSQGYLLRDVDSKYELSNYIGESRAKRIQHMQTFLKIVL